MYNGNMEKKKKKKDLVWKILLAYVELTFIQNNDIGWMFVFIYGRFFDWRVVGFRHIEAKSVPTHPDYLYVFMILSLPDHGHQTADNFRR